MKCPKCGNLAQSDAIFCDQCGARLATAAATDAAMAAPAPSAPSVEPQPVAPPVAAPAPYAPVMQAAGSLCPKCGSANTPGELFCSECGAPLETPQPEPQMATVTPPAPVQPISATGAACPDCGAEVQPADEFCYACGAELKGRAAAAVTAPSAPESAPAPAPVQPVAAPQPDVATEAPVPLTECPSCGADVKPEDTFCAFCGAALVAAAATTVVAAPSPALQPVAPAPSATVAAGPTTSARLVLQPSGIELPLPLGQEIIIGREDPFSGVFPDIDLTPHGAEEGGISRRHLRIRRVAGGYTAEDLNSTNYTFVNRVQLKPGQPVALTDGDEVRAGRIRLLFRTGS